jgi:hypothetical protein
MSKPGGRIDRAKFRESIKNPIPVSGKLVHNGQEFDVKV